MNYRSLEGYFAPAREAWLAEQRSMEAEAQARGVSAEQVKYEHREAAKEREHAAQAMRNASLAEALRRQEAKAHREAEQLAAQQAWWAAVAQGDLQAGPPLTEDDRQRVQAHAKREREAALDRQWAWEDSFRLTYGRYPTDAETRAAGMWANG